MVEICCCASFDFAFMTTLHLLETIERQGWQNAKAKDS